MKVKQNFSHQLRRQKCFTYCIRWCIVSRDSIVDGDWLHATDWIHHYDTTICNHCGVMTAWSRKTWKFFEHFLGERPIMVKYFKFYSESFHRFSSPIDVVVLNCRKMFPMGNRRNRALFTGQKQNFGSLSNCRNWADRAQNLPGPALNIWLTLFQISSKSVNFRRSYDRTRDGRSFAP